MSALEELRSTGTLGVEGTRLLYETVHAVTRFRNFPPPEGQDSWTHEAVLECAHDFLSHPRTPQRLASLAASAADDRQLGRLLNVAIVNYLRDQARATDRGHVIGRMREVLDDGTGRVVRLPAAEHGEELWALPEAMQGPRWERGPEELVVVAWRLNDLHVVRWERASRRGPIADRASWHRLAEAVLTHAGGPVASKVLAEVAEHRFGLLPRPHSVPIDDVDGDPPALPASAPPTEIAEQAAEAWDQLSDRDRIVIAHHDAPVRDLAERLGLGKSAAADSRARTMKHLAGLLADCDDPDEVALALAEACAQWIADRTGGAANPSH